MKIIRLFVGFVVVSLILGIGGAFNGQSVPKIAENDDEISEKVELPELTNVDESTDIVNNQPIEEKDVKETNNITAEKSKEQKQVNKNSSSNQDKQQKTTQNNQVKDNSNSNVAPNSVENSQVIETPKEEKNENTNTDEQFNAMFYSITHGNAEYSTLAECNAVGYRVKDNELNEVLDWNENNPDNFKQPTIKAHWCYEVMKNGKINYFLHFITETGANMDSELKNKYK
ncbi:MAG: hypothetical protein J6K36_01185 [Bacilli bacterium]|nr:hypothetical protein [Bacilli bacterium]